jgi:integrase
MQTDTRLQPLHISTDWQPAFADHLRTRKLAPKSQALAAQHIRVFSLWYQAKFNADFDPSLLTNYDLTLYRDWTLNHEKAAARTWNSRLWALTILCGYIGDPALIQGIEPKSHSRASAKHRSLTKDEYHRLIHAIELNVKKNHSITLFQYQDAVRDRASALLMLHGLRVDECAQVELDDLDLDKPRSGHVLVRNGKGSKERIVPLNLLARTALRLWRDVRPDPTTQAFIGVSNRTLQRSVASLGAQIRVPDLTCHWLRYTFAKRLEANGTPIAAISELLGHATIEQTSKYLRSSLEELQSAVEGVM